MATIELLTSAITQYLARHPNAEDDLEGIANGWLMPFRFRIDRQTLLESLARLEADGNLTRRLTVDGRTVFARRSDRP